MISFNPYKGCHKVTFITISVLIGEKTKAQGAYMTCPRSYGQQMAELGFEFRSVWHHSSNKHQDLATVMNSYYFNCIF